MPYIDPARTKPHETLDLDIAIVGPKIDVQPVLDGFGFGRQNEQQPGCLVGLWLNLERVWVVVHDDPTQCSAPPTSKVGWSDRANNHLLPREAHPANVPRFDPLITTQAPTPIVAAALKDFGNGSLRRASAQPFSAETSMVKILHRLSGPHERSLSRQVIFVACATLAASACAGAADGAAPALVEVTYDDIGAPGYIDQAVTLSHSGSGIAVPRIEYTPLDASGAPVDGVEVSTAFGSDRGLLAITPRGGFDVLAFNGTRAADVVGVDSNVVDIDELGESSALAPSDPVPLLGSQLVSKFDVFDSVEISNEGEGQIAVRVVCLLYNAPAPGEAQQAEEISVVAERIEVSGESSVVASASPSFTAEIASRGFGCDSLKAHLTP